MAGGGGRVAVGIGRTVPVIRPGCVTTGAGTDTILGDNGIVELDAATGSLFVQITSTQAGFGGADVILAGNGNKNVLGGYGADRIELGMDVLDNFGNVIAAGAGDHIVIGDNGQVRYNSAGKVVSYETTDTAAGTGGDDTISTGAGNNTVLGGMGADRITTAIGDDTILGDNGSVVARRNGRVLLAHRLEPAEPGR